MGNGCPTCLGAGAECIEGSAVGDWSHIQMNSAIGATMTFDGSGSYTQIKCTGVSSECNCLAAEKCECPGTASRCYTTAATGECSATGAGARCEAAGFSL